MKQTMPAPVQALVSALGTLIYISLVACLMINGQWLFGPQMGTILGPIMLLLLFVFSATVTGLLVLGRPAYLFLTGDRKTAISLLLYTVGWLFIITLGVLMILAFRYMSGRIVY